MIKFLVDATPSLKGLDQVLTIPLQSIPPPVYQNHTQYSLMLLGMVFLGLIGVTLILTLGLRPKKPSFRLIFRSANSTRQDKIAMKKISNAVTSFVLTFTGLTAAETPKDTPITVTSSNDNILRVVEVEPRKFEVSVLSVGQAAITVSTKADTIDAQPVTQVFEFDVEDSTAEVTHFGMQVTDIKTAA